MTIAIDASSPATVRTTSGSVVASPSFSPPAKSLLLIGIGDANNNSTTASFTDNLGTHLTYTRKVRSTGSGGQGQAELWIADVPATAPGPMVVTGTFTGSGGGCNTISILVLTSADPVALQAGATALGNWNKTGSTAIALTTLRDKSWVFAFTADWNSATAPTFPGGQTDVFNGNTMLGQNVPSGTQCFLHGFTAPTSPAGATSQSFTMTGPGLGSQVAVEIQPASVVPKTNKFMAVA